jgi:hypothetical protein
MKFKNFCLVIMGTSNGKSDSVIKEIEKISESKPNILDAKGMIIATFTSFVDVNEISTWFTLNNRNFLIFELNKDTCGYFITKPELHNGLFSFLTESDKNLKAKTDEFINSISRNVTDIEYKDVPTKIGTSKVREITEADVNKMTKDEKDNLYNKLIDNGVDKLTDNDKKILILLCK